MKNTITNLNQDEVKRIFGGKWWADALAVLSPIIVGAMGVGL